MQIHGVQVDKLKGRFTGTIDEVEEDDFRYDRVVMMVVSARTSIGSIETRDDGEVVATMKLKVQDMVPLEGEMRDRAVSFMAHGADQGFIIFDQPVAAIVNEPAAAPAAPVADYARPPEPEPDVKTVDADGVVTRKPVQDPDEEFDVPPAAPPPVRPRAGDVEPPAAPAEEPSTTPVGVRIGTVYPGGRKDKELADFLSGP